VENGNPNYDSRQNCNAIIETNKDKLIVGCKNSTFPNDITSIGDFAFSGCAELGSILLPSSIQNIGKGAFQRCSKLKSINVPKSVLSIGEQAFVHCENLESIVVEDGNYKYDSRDDCNAIINKSTRQYLKVLSQLENMPLAVLE
jgi:hypothetical protein